MLSKIEINGITKTPDPKLFNISGSNTVRLPSTWWKGGKITSGSPEATGPVK